HLDVVGEGEALAAGRDVEGSAIEHNRTGAQAGGVLQVDGGVALNHGSAAISVHYVHRQRRGIRRNQHRARAGNVAIAGKGISAGIDSQGSGTQELAFKIDRGVPRGIVKGNIVAIVKDRRGSSRQSPVGAGQDIPEV